MDLDITPMWDALRDNPIAGPLVIEPVEAINEAGGFYEPDRPAREWLRPTPVPGVYITPNEVVDPRDCEKWPNSPYCNASETFALEDLRKPLSADFKPTASKCEVCIEFYPRVLGVAMTPSVICTRNDTPQCQVPPNAPKPPAELDLGENPPYYLKAAARNNSYRLVYAANVRTQWFVGSNAPDNPSHTSEEWSDIRQSHFEQHGMQYGSGGWTQTAQILPPKIEPGITRVPISAGWTFQEDFQREDFATNGWKFNFGSNWFYEREQKLSVSFGGGKTHTINAILRVTDRTCVMWEDYLCSGVDPYSQASVVLETANNLANENIVGLFQRYTAWQVYSPDGEYSDSTGNYDFIPPSPVMGIYDVAISESCNYRPKPVPQPIPEKDDPMSCCEETLELLEAIYTRLGVDEFPVSAPQLLTQSGDKESPLENHAQLWEWTARNLDALLGQFPIKIKIKDSDPTAEGNQEVELELPNVAETLAELFGLTYQAEMNSDLISEMLLRLIPEVLATKNAAITGQSYSKANASALGYQGNSKEVAVDYNFDIKNPQSLPQFLRETKGKVTVYQDDSRESVLDILAKLEFASGIIKAAFYTKPSDKDRLLESIESMIQDEALSIPNKEQWRDWLQRLNRDTGKHNEGQVIQPEIVENVHEGIDKL